MLNAAFLGLIQALTEFLPVSSSGHLVLGKVILGMELDGGAATEVAMHFGTLMSVIVLFFKDIIRLFKATARLMGNLGRVRYLWHEDPDIRLLVAIIIGCIPAGVIGLLFKDQLESAFNDPRGVCVALLCTGGLLLTTVMAPVGKESIRPLDALIIGVAQAVAIIPGISRSGSTISVAQFLGIERVDAARFSFLMSLPVIAGATLLKGKDMLANPPPADTLAALGVGAAVSFVVGLGALWALMQLVRQGKFSIFGWYCLTLGVVGLIMLQ
ncbi:MAG: undecaprenyl-diphosphate phosphatase [Bradymonadia bacterium]